MIDINTNNEEDDELPMPSKKKREKTLPPASKDKLIHSGSRINRIRRKTDSDEPPKSQDEQIYNKKKIEEEEEKQPPKKIQIEFMKPNGSSIYQTLLEFHRIYAILYFVIEELLYVYKCHFFDFPQNAAGVEITTLIFYLIIQIGRIYFGSLGNRAEASVFVLLSFAYSFGIAYNYFHFIFMQTYTLRIEIITNSIGLVIWFFETIFGLLALIGISGKESGI